MKPRKISIGEVRSALRIAWKRKVDVTEYDIAPLLDTQDYKQLRIALNRLAVHGQEIGRSGREGGYTYYDINQLKGEKPRPSASDVAQASELIRRAWA